MAIGSASVQSISRSGGRSATAAAAYRTAGLVVDERTGQVHDYTRKGGVAEVAMYLPDGAPAMTTGELWNRAEAAENRKNSQVARELLVALPHELTDAQRRELVDGIARALVERYGVAAEAAIHRPGREGDHRNHHAHIMFTTRRMDGAGQLGEKTRELDVKPRSSAEVTWIRGMVEEQTNRALEVAGVDARIDMRSLKDQGIDAPRPVHEGPAVTAMRRRGAPSNVAQLSDYQREIRRDRAELERVSAQILDFAKAKAEREAMRDVEGDALAQARKALEDARAEAERLRVALAAPQPRCVTVALELRDSYREAAAQAERWRQEHPVKALLGKVIEPEPVRLARERLEAFMASPERAEGLRWQEQRAEQRERLAGLQERLQGLQEATRAAEVRVMAREPLAALQERLQAAVGELERLEPRMTHDDRHSAQRRRTKLVDAVAWSPSKESLAVACIEARELLEPARALAQRGDKERVKELVTETLRDLHLATAASSARGASDEQRDRLFALCDEVRAISEPLERRRATHDWPALEEAQKLRETARELRREGEGLSDELSRQRELQREMRAHSRTDGRPRGPRLG